jgi:hypothetical protein
MANIIPPTLRSDFFSRIVKFQIPSEHDICNPSMGCRTQTRPNPILWKNFHTFVPLADSENESEEDYRTGLFFGHFQ